MNVVLANPRGFCAASIAVKIVDLALRSSARRSMSAARSFTTATSSAGCEKGPSSSRSWAKCLAGAVAILAPTALHPTSSRRSEAGFRLIDATCPLVTKVHLEVHRLSSRGITSC